MRETGMISRPFLMLSLISTILGVLLGDQHRLHAAAEAANSLFRPPIGAPGRAA
jgi:hypothetical protein